MITLATVELRAPTDDGATILGTKFINFFLVHEHEKGVMFCKIKDCIDRLREVGLIEATHARNDCEYQEVLLLF